MKKEELFADSRGLLDKPELNNLKLLFAVNLFLLVTDFIMPQYFGLHLGYDLTCTRLANVILILYALLHINVFNVFSDLFVRCSATIPLMLYLLVTMYTMVFRVDINAFMLVFFEVLTFFMLLLAIRYVIGIRNALRIIIFCAYFLSAYGFIEFLAGESLYLRFLRTVPTNVRNVVRSGYYRIMGPCGHPLGYGLLLLIFIAVACIDYEKDEIFVYKRPVLLVLLVANVFLTGSRSSEAFALIEVVCLILFSTSVKRKQAILYSLLIVAGLGIFVLLTYKTRIGNYIILQFAVLIDQVFGTTISLNFGAELTRLEDSEGYRECLPLIFKLDWLNPFIGRGVKSAFAAEMMNKKGETFYIISIDNYYVSQYIKYAYPGLIAYVVFILTTLVTMIKSAIRYKSGTIVALAVGFTVYFINLYWLDALQTLKFMYAIIAVFYALLFLFRDCKVE